MQAPLAAETRRIEPAAQRLRLRDLRHLGNVLWVVTRRDLRAKYKQSLLGAAWLVLQPLGLLIGLVVGFGSVLDLRTGGIPYPLFALTGLVAWTFLQAALSIGSASLVSNQQLVVRTAAPRVAFPLAGVLATLPTLAVTLGSSVAYAAVTGHLGWRALLLPGFVLWLVALTAGAVAFTSAIAVWFRDMLQALPFLLQAGIFLAPVGYPLERAGEPLATLLRLNPITGLIEVARWLVLDAYRPDVAAVATSAGLTLVIVVVGWRFFARCEVHVADVI